MAHFIASKEECKHSNSNYGEPYKQRTQLLSRKKNCKAHFQCPDDLVSVIQSSLNGKTDPVIMSTAVSSLAWSSFALFMGLKRQVFLESTSCFRNRKSMLKRNVLPKHSPALPTDTRVRMLTLRQLYSGLLLFTPTEILGFY